MGTKKRNEEEERAETESEGERGIRKVNIEGPRKRKKDSNAKINNECDEVDAINNKIGQNMNNKVDKSDK